MHQDGSVSATVSDAEAAESETTSCSTLGVLSSLPAPSGKVPMFNHICQLLHPAPFFQTQVRVVPIRSFLSRTHSNDPPYDVIPSIYLSQQLSRATMFSSKKKVALFVCSKSVEEKKPFVVKKSSKKRYVVSCPDGACPFRMSFFKRADGQFHLVEDRPHCCSSLLPTLKKTWFMSHIEAMVKGDLNVTKADAKKQLKDKYEINVNDALLGRYLSLGKSEYFRQGLSFGLIENYLQVVSTLNEGTATNLCTDGDLFKRAFCFRECALTRF